MCQIFQQAKYLNIMYINNDNPISPFNVYIFVKMTLKNNVSHFS